MFSCCSLRLHDIINYVNKNHYLPVLVDSSKMFSLYKNENDCDITFEYFTHYNEIIIKEMEVFYDRFIDYNEGYENIRFDQLHFESLTPFIKKYFTPSENICQKILFLEKKYSIDYDNICVIFYRGNDKGREIKLHNYDDYIIIVDNIIINNPTVKLLIQSDETEFIEFMTKKYSQAFFFKDEIRHMKKCDSTVDRELRKDIKQFSYYYMAITIIMSKCKYVVCGSGNCSIWIALFRGNTENFFQLYDNHIVRLKAYHYEKEQTLMNAIHKNKEQTLMNAIHKKKETHKKKNFMFLM